MSGKPAARQSDPTSCPLPGHGTNPVATGSPDVIFDGLPAARMWDKTACGGAISGAVSSTVFINGMPAALVGSTSDHGGVIIGGSGTVIIGDTVVLAPVTPPSNLSSAPTTPPMVTVRGVSIPASTMVSHFVAPTQASVPAALPPDPLTAAAQILSDFQNRQSAVRVFNDPANPMGTPTDPFEKSKIIEQLKVRVARAHGQNMTSSTFVPTYPHQSDTSLCGPAAFFYALLMDRPDLYTQAITELWETGETTIGSLHIKPSHGCRNPKNLSYRREGDRVLAIDWISLASLRDSENNLMEYDSPDDQVPGITLPWTIESWFIRAGATEVFSNIQPASISLSGLLELLTYLGSQHHVVSLVSASMVEGGIGAGKNHWIVWEDLPKTSSGAITVTTPANEQITDSRLFSWGSLGHQVTRGFTVRQLLGDVFGGKVFSRIP
ncbi:Zn-binding Pro-Ala-Ala-Arg (PAAR) domain-containing protein, incolved in TypeVI secretion [Geopseudomonas sagittaria]|uniref:Zn-binding Pro-Ala-Ala-Arg (PAAR) domain-containing protein, incolved in TypeVI secretion n=1 Tax=Geopseudomonas sagittaria TaxID=1135990 RepID=A0A1I5S3E5_9GAMM|nr:Zn-binding Pro-Ala-Ala-Arg (PAAR) domain-containing protein, incolved in TypeVI secretion [Pseudomonas sagittaria]